METADAQTHRPVTHILHDLEQAEKEAARVDRELKGILAKLGLKAEAYNA